MKAAWPHDENSSRHELRAATTLPVALRTMHDALMTNGRLKKGESVLVQGASSGVGLMALKIARLMGADLVIGTSTNEARRARLKEFGADLALDSRWPDWVEAAQKATGGKGVDLIIDQISGHVAIANMQAASVLGRIVNVGRLGGMKAPGRRHQRGHAHFPARKAAGSAWSALWPRREAAWIAQEAVLCG